MAEGRTALIVGLSIAIGAATTTPLRAEDWPQWRGKLRDGVWRETGIVERFDGPDLEPRWRTPLGGGYAGPAVAQGKVYVTDRQADTKTERVLCLDEATGKELWKHEYACSYKGLSYDAGPRATPTVHQGKVYALGAMGNLFCFDADTSKVIWSKDYRKDFGTKLPIWGTASAPLVDGQRLITLVGGRNGAAVVAFDKDTGHEIWRALEVKDTGYVPPMIYQVGPVRQLIIWHPEAVVALDPRTGQTYWQVPFHTEQGVTIMTPVYLDPVLFISQSWAGPLVLELAKDRPAAKVMYRLPSDGTPNEDLINCLISTPILRDKYLYGVALYGELRCLTLADGRRVWGTQQFTGEARWSNAFLIPNGDRVFLANEHGELIIARFSPTGVEEISRARLIEPTGKANRRPIVWSHPAFANKNVYARNDKEIIAVSLAAEPPTR